VSQLKVLLIDDDEKLGGLLVPYLASFGIDLVTAQEPDLGLKMLRNESPAVVLLDLMLPKRDGFTVCKEIRQTSAVPVLMLTARGELADRVTGLELGADDYLAKPFEPRELVARIHALARRLKTEGVGSALRMDRNARRVWLHQKEIELTGAEYDLLTLLASEPGKKWDRDEIVQALRGHDSNIFSRSVDILVSRLRAKIEVDPKNPLWIKTVRGMGYVFTEGGTP
jgi:DNA-binding response OmpR family regulator